MHLTAFVGVEGGLVFDVSFVVEFFYAFVVGGGRGYFAQLHDVFAVDADWVLAAVYAPSLEQGEVEAHVAWVEVVGGGFGVEVGEGRHGNCEC